MCPFFFFNDTATTEIYTLSLHDALPISRRRAGGPERGEERAILARSPAGVEESHLREDRKSTRLNSSHSQISYAVFCLKKKKTIPPSYTASSRSNDRARLRTLHVSTQ